MVSPRGLIMNHSKEQKLGMPLLTSSDKDRDVYFGVYLKNMCDVLFWQVFSTSKRDDDFDDDDDDAAGGGGDDDDFDLSSTLHPSWWSPSHPTPFRYQVPLSHAEHLAVLPPAQYSSGQIETPRRSDGEGSKYWDDSALWVLQHLGSSGGCDQESSLVFQGLVTVPFWVYWTSPYNSHYRPYT